MSLVKATTAVALITALALPVAADAEGRKGRGGAIQMFETIDANNDGQLTQAELAAHREARFNENDTNNDGQLSREEMLAAAEGKRGSDRRARRIGRMIERVDTNGDGAVSLAEMNAREDGRMFRRLDQDGDGVITRAEAEDARGRFGRRGDRG